MIPVINCDRALSLAEVLQLPFSALDHDSSGQSLTIVVEFVIAVDPQFLYFGARGEFLPYTGPEQMLSGNFIEGLWRYDVAELFICDDTTSQYQEFNLSPHGLWWTGAFESYRVRQEVGIDSAQRGVVSAASSGKKWQVGLRFPLSDLSVSCSWVSSSRCNVSAIIGHEQRDYLSWAAMPISPPDFHRTEYFEQIDNRRII